MKEKLEEIKTKGLEKIKNVKTIAELEEVRKELQKVADELGLPITDCRVAYAWSEKGNSYDKHVSDELMVPLYFPIGK